MADVGQTLEKTTGGSRGARGGRGGRTPPDAPAVSPEAAGGQEDPSLRDLPTLPDTKTRSGVTLEEKTVMLYGPTGIGKTTLASEWADGNVFFFNTAGELNDIEVYEGRVGSWNDFKKLCLVLERNPGKYAAAAIDTVDVLALHCSAHWRKKLGIVHESDAEWGKGWSMVRDDFHATLAKLASLPGGLILVGHSRELEIKTRTTSYTKQDLKLTGGIRDVCVALPDLVLFVDWSDDDARVIKTKPSPYWEAKERGAVPRLAPEIAWPVGQSGWAVLKEAWDG